MGVLKSNNKMNIQEPITHPTQKLEHDYYLCAPLMIPSLFLPPFTGNHYPESCVYHPIAS